LSTRKRSSNGAATRLFRVSTNLSNEPLKTASGEKRETSSSQCSKYSRNVRYRTRATEGTSADFGSKRQSYTANSAKFVRMQMESCFVHPYIRSWCAGPRSRSRLTSGFLVSTYNFRRPPGWKEESAAVL